MLISQLQGTRPPFPTDWKKNPEFKCVEGAIPGKPLNKRKLTSTDADKKAKNEGISVRRCKFETCWRICKRKLIGVKIPLLKILQYFPVRQKWFRSYEIRLPIGPNVLWSSKKFRGHWNTNQIHIFPVLEALYLFTLCLYTGELVSISINKPARPSRAPDNFLVQRVFTPWFLTQCWFSKF